MADPIATAFVLVRPLLTGFAAALTTEVNAAVLSAQAKVKPIVIPVTTIGGAGAAGAASAVAVAQTEVAETAILSTEAERLLQRQLALGGVVLGEATVANETLAAAQGEVAATARIADAAVGRTTGGTRRAAKGFFDIGEGADIARGGIIGLARVTPVAVFGLGLVGTAAIAAGLAITKSIGSAAKLEQTLNVFQVVTDATAEQMKQVSQAAIDLGADLTLPAVSAIDAADALFELSKAGLSIADSLAAAKGVLQLGTAAGLAPAEAAQIVATQLNAFNLNGEKAVHVADLLAGASIAAQGEIQDFGLAMQQVSAVANQVGLSVEVTTGALTELAKAGLKGADAGTSLRVLLLRLVPTTKEAAQFQHALGIEFDNSRSAGEQLPELLEQYRNALNLLTPAQQQLALAQIFGQDAIRSAAILIHGGAGALDENTAAANRNGIAAKLAAAQTKGLSGAFGNLGSQLETVGTQVGGFATGPLTLVINGIAEIVGNTPKAAESLGILGDAVVQLAQDIRDNFPGDSGGAAKFWGDAMDFIGDKTVDVTQKANDYIIALGGVHDAIFGTFAGLADVSARNPFPAGTNFTINPDPRTQAAIDAQERAARAGAVIIPTPEAIRAQRAIDNPPEDPAVRAIRLENERKRRKAITDSLAPRFLRDPVLKAQMAGNLQAELAADQDIIDFFKKRLSQTKEGTARYTTVLTALNDATDQRDSVQQQIDSDAEAAASKRKSDAQKAAAATKAALDVREAELRFAADAAGNLGAAEDKLLKFLQERVNNTKRGTEERITAQRNLRDELERRAKADQSFLQVSQQLEKAIIDNAISRAKLTTTTVDDKAAENRLLKFLRHQRDLAVTVANHAKKGTEAEKKAQLAVQEWQAQINSTLADIQGVGSSGFTLNDLWKSAADQLTEFGSNISFGPMTPGENVQSVASNILSQKPDSLAGVVASKADKQISEAQTSNQYLREIRDFLRVPGVQGGTPWKRRNPLTDTPGTAADAAKFAVAGVGGM